MQWLASNWQGVLSLVSLVIGVVVAGLHLGHLDSAASSLASIENILNQIANGNQNPPAPPKS